MGPPSIFKFAITATLILSGSVLATHQRAVADTGRVQHYKALLTEHTAQQNTINTLSFEGALKWSDVLDGVATAQCSERCLACGPGCDPMCCLAETQEETPAPVPLFTLQKASPSASSGSGSGQNVTFPILPEPLACPCHCEASCPAYIQAICCTVGRKAEVEAEETQETQEEQQEQQEQQITLPILPEPLACPCHCEASCPAYIQAICCTVGRKAKVEAEETQETPEIQEQQQQQMQPSLPILPEPLACPCHCEASCPAYIQAICCTVGKKAEEIQEEQQQQQQQQQASAVKHAAVSEATQKVIVQATQQDRHTDLNQRPNIPALACPCHCEASCPANVQAICCFTPGSGAASAANEGELHASDSEAGTSASGNEAGPEVNTGGVGASDSDTGVSGSEAGADAKKAAIKSTTSTAHYDVLGLIAQTASGAPVSILAGTNLTIFDSFITMDLVNGLGRAEEITFNAETNTFEVVLSIVLSGRDDQKTEKATEKALSQSFRVIDGAKLWEREQVMLGLGCLARMGAVQVKSEVRQGENQMSVGVPVLTGTK